MTPCHEAGRMIRDRDFVGWQGLPSTCRPEQLLGLAVDEQWGSLSLGSDAEPAQSRLLDLDGYYRPMLFARHGSMALFDGMNPVLADPWPILAADLGEPEARLNWVHGVVPMPAGELVYAQRGITVSLNPANDFVAYLSVYPPTDVDHYTRLLRRNRAK